MSLFRFLFLASRSKSIRPSHPEARGNRHRLLLEVLEDRTVPSTVTNLADSGSGSLRDAIVAANAHPGADTIDFAPGLQGTIALTSGELLITESVAIHGPGASRLAVSGNDASRVFEIASGQN